MILTFPSVAGGRLPVPESKANAPSPRTGLDGRAAMGNDVHLRIDVGGEYADVRVPAWRGAWPEVVEISREGADRGTTQVIGADTWDRVNWQETFRQHDGWVAGKLLMAEPLGVSRYDVRYRQELTGEVTYELSAEGDTGPPVRIQVSTPETGDGEAPSTDCIICVAIVAIVVVGTIACAVLQRDALEACGNAATDGCGAGNVRSFDFEGRCGFGSCEYECN